MADATLKRHDTWPPLRGRAEDSVGNALALVGADFLLFLMKTGATLVSGTAVVINPPDADGMNWKYVWATGDTDIAGTYQAELEIHWDEGTTPKEIETVPNDRTLEVVILQDQGP